MVQLIKIDRLGPRIEGMLYRKKFDETWSLLDDVSNLNCLSLRIFNVSCRARGNCQKLAMLSYMPNISRSC